MTSLRFTLLIVFLLASGVVIPSRAQAVTPPGLVILGPLPRPDRLPEALAMAWSDALSFVRANPDDFGYPQPDRVTGSLVLPTTSGAAATKAAAWTPRPEAAGVIRQTRAAKYSYAQLEAIKNLAIGASSGLPDATDIYMTAPDWDNSRVLIYVDHVNDVLFQALVAAHGTEAIAIVVDPHPTPFLRSVSRDFDSSPFYGGAAIRTTTDQCTSAFPFRGFASEYYMLTAGHCGRNLGDVWTGLTANYVRMGPVNSGYVNWGSSGTFCLSGQCPNMHGDLALILIDTGTADPYIYVGAAHTDVRAALKEKWSRYSANGDQFCTGGAQTGEQCGWTVTNVGVNTCRGDCSVVARNVVTGDRVGTPCLTNGDSGGPVYTIRPDLGIAAKGVAGGAGGSGNIIDPCRVDYTDIYEVSYAWPVTLWIQ